MYTYIMARIAAFTVRTYVRTYIYYSNLMQCCHCFSSHGLLLPRIWTRVREQLCAMPFCILGDDDSQFEEWLKDCVNHCIPVNVQDPL